MLTVFANAQTEQSNHSVDVFWLGKGSGCYCPLNLCLEVCWCDTLVGDSNCVPGSEVCNIDCNSSLQPGDMVVFTNLNVNVPTGKHIFLRHLIFNFSCYGTFIFDLNSPDGIYDFPLVVLKPGCPPLHISYYNGHIMFSTGN